MAGKRFTIANLLALITVVAVLFAVGIPIVVRLRATARVANCRDNLKQTMYAVHNYHSAYRRMPPAMGGTAGNLERLSGLVSLTPFIEQQALWEELSSPMLHNGIGYPAMGPKPWNKAYPAWQTSLAVFQCLADAENASPAQFGRTNITFCIGDSVNGIHDPKTSQDFRGMFSPGSVTKVRDVLDGLSYTIAIGEIRNVHGRRVAGQFAINQPKTMLANPQGVLDQIKLDRGKKYDPVVALSDLGRGGNWADGAAGYSLFQTILPPNSPSIAVGGTSGVDGYFAPGSPHLGGCYIGMGDGSVRFISDAIDTGDLKLSPARTIRSDSGEIIRSPYGVWGAIGTRASMEALPDTEF